MRLRRGWWRCAPIGFMWRNCSNIVTIWPVRHACWRSPGFGSKGFPAAHRPRTRRVGSARHPHAKKFLPRRQAAPGAALPPAFSQHLHECKRAPRSAPATRREGHQPTARRDRRRRGRRTRTTEASKRSRITALVPTLAAVPGAAWQITGRVPARPIPAPPCAPRSGPAYAQAAASHRSLQTRSGDRGSAPAGCWTLPKAEVDRRRAPAPNL